MPAVHLSATETVDEDSYRYEGWGVAAASGVGLFLDSVLVYSFAIFFKPLSQEFSWSRETISAAYAALAMMAAGAAAQIGYMVDRFGPRRVVPVI